MSFMQPKQSQTPIHDYQGALSHSDAGINNGHILAAYNEHDIHRCCMEGTSLLNRPVMETQKQG